MSRRYKNKERAHRHTDPELWEHLRNQLQTIESLCATYDSNRPYIAFSIATEIQKVLTDGMGRRVRGSLRYSTVIKKPDPLELSAEVKLITYKLERDPPSLFCLPHYQGSERPTTTVDFKDWWNRDIIYRANASGKTDGLIPILEAEQVPYLKRPTLSRRELVEQTRNKFGAHLDAEVPELLHELQSTKLLGISFGVQLPDGSIVSTDDGSLKTYTGPAAAMVRQIAHELMEAFGGLELP